LWACFSEVERRGVRPGFGEVYLTNADNSLFGRTGIAVFSGKEGTEFITYHFRFLIGHCRFGEGPSGKKAVFANFIDQMTNLK
jgi:hypothetical protein